MPDPALQFEQFNLVAADVAASVAFYEALGLEFEPSPAEWASHHRSAVFSDGVDFDIDSPEFARVWNAGWRDRPGRPSGVVGFRLDSRDAVDARCAALHAAGYVVQQPPYDTFWGARYAIVEDPDGNAVGLMSPSDPDRRRPPPDPTSWGAVPDA
ncbi:MAG TPA: VOC family protein [Dehalococcoidia bacterium]|nr:VOC family protein [Dehalococcoidia bacterium]